MKRLLCNIIWELTFLFDYTIGYSMTKPTKEKLYCYHRYMWEKYGRMYCTEAEWKMYESLYSDNSDAWY